MVAFYILFIASALLSSSSYAFRITSSSKSSSISHKYINNINRYKHHQQQDRHQDRIMVLNNIKSTNEINTVDDINYKADIQRTILWVAAAMGFAGLIVPFKGVDSAVEFVSGYFIEQSLSIDNLFVFLVLFDYFGVGRDKQKRVLDAGIYGAVILRGIFIGLGSVVLQQFHQVLLVFAAVLFVSAFKIITSNDDDDEDDDLSNNAIINFAKRFLKTTDKFDGVNFFTVENGVKLATPLLLCLVSVELSDIVFAFDSVPAVFGITKDPFIVFTSNIFAIAGLRSLFGVLSQAVADLQYLEKAVGFVLLLIATKLTTETFDIELLTPLQSLIAVLTILGGGVTLSVIENNKKKEIE